MESEMLNRYVGKYVLVRSRNEGINAGFVHEATEYGIVLLEARRLWYHKPLDKSISWYEGVSLTGVSEDSVLSCAVEEKAIVEDYSITLCSDAARDSIREAESNHQS